MLRKILGRIYVAPCGYKAVSVVLCMHPLEGKVAGGSFVLLLSIRFGDSALWRCIVVVASR